MMTRFRLPCGRATRQMRWFRLPENAEFSGSISDLHVSFCSHFSAHARKSKRRSFDLVGQLRIELLPMDDVFCSHRTCTSSSSSSHEWLQSNVANHAAMSLGLIGSLPKFSMPKMWQAMILASIWFATKTCQTLTFSLPNLW